MDGRASRGPGRAVRATRQSTAADLGVATRVARVSVRLGPASSRGGPWGCRASVVDTLKPGQLTGAPWPGAGAALVGPQSGFSTHVNFSTPPNLAS